MGDHDDRRPGFVDLLQKTHDILRSLRVQISRRLVRQQKLRPVHQGSGDGDALLLSAGKFPDIRLVLCGKPHPAEDLRNIFPDLRSALSDHALGKSDIFIDIQMLQKTTGLDLRVFEDAITFKIALMVVKYMKYMESIDY